jgi:hypothetical protein
MLFFVTSLFPVFLASRNGGAPPAAMGAAAKRVRRLQERRSCVEIQLFVAGGRGCPCLNFIRPCLPRPASCTVKSEGTAKSDGAGSVR